jgi:DHA1 family multidrug resistance protein-like MFS transporter
VNRKVLGLLFVTLFIVMLGFSILFPVEAYYIKSFGADERSMGVIITLYSLMQFIFSPIWGRLSDRIGRKPVIMIGLAGYAISMALFGASTHLWHLYVARALAGTLSSATLPTAMAVVADATDAEHRTRGMGFLGAAFGLGVIFGPALGGMLSERGLWLPYFVTAGLAALNLLFVALLLPESLPPEKRGRKEAAPASRWAAFHRAIAALYFLSFIVSFSLAGLESTFGFLAADRLGLAARQVSYMFVLMGITGAFVQGYLIGKVTKRCGEVRAMQAGLLISSLGFAIIALSHQAWLSTLGLAVFAGGNGMIRPSNASLISRRAKVGQGLAIGLLDSFDSMGRILGPIVGGLLFYRSDALPFALGAVLTLLSALVFTLLYGGGREPDAQRP